MSVFSKSWDSTKSTLREGYIRTHNFVDDNHWSIAGSVGAGVGSIAGTGTASMTGYDPHSGSVTGGFVGAGAGLTFKRYGGAMLAPRIGYTPPTLLPWG